MFKDNDKMDEDFQIKNKVADSGLVNFDLSKLVPNGERKAVSYTHLDVYKRQTSYRLFLVLEFNFF